MCAPPGVAGLGPRRARGARFRTHGFGACLPQEGKTKEAELTSAAILKVVLTPGLIAAATLVGRRWGPGVSGAVTGLPLTSLPVSVFLAVEQGPAFAARAALGTLLGLIGQATLCVAASWAGRRGGWPLGVAAGVAA